MSQTRSNNKRRLSIITLSLFANNNSDQNLSNRKTPRIFEDPNGAVGLGIVAAMHDLGPQDPLFSQNRANPIPVLSHVNSTGNLGRKNLSFEEMEMSEEYTCVISHVGNNLVKKREYFDGDFLGVTEGFSEKLRYGTSVGASDLVDAVAQSFLNSCFLCKKQLHGLDIFMYRGETAFCSDECRYKHISFDEHEKCSFGVMNPTDSFPCFASVA